MKTATMGKKLDGRLFRVNGKPFRVNGELFRVHGKLFHSVFSFTLGSSQASGGNPSVDAFGVIALVAMTPLIAIQVLGILFKIKSNRAEKAKIESDLRDAASKYDPEAKE